MTTLAFLKISDCSIENGLAEGKMKRKDQNPLPMVCWYGKLAAELGEVAGLER